MKYVFSRGGAGALLGAATLLLLSAALGGAAAQSGRRAGRVRPTPEPMPIITPKLDAEPAARPGRNLPDVPLFVAARVGARVTKARAEVIYHHVAARLGASMKVSSLGLARREEAIKRAREQAWPYVVYVEFEFEPIRDGEIVFSSPDIVVKYSILDAQTGKTQGKGKVYYRPNNAAGTMPGDDPVKITPEAAGEETAERVLDWFAISAPRAKT